MKFLKIMFRGTVRGIVALSVIFLILTVTLLPLHFTSVSIAYTVVLTILGIYVLGDS
jgi:hypothetical protein